MTLPKIRASYLLLRVLISVLTPEPLADRISPDLRETPLELAQRHEQATGGGLFDPNTVAPFAESGAPATGYPASGRSW